MSSPTSAGVFQTHIHSENDSVLIQDDIYGETLVHEPVLVELLRSPEVQRLQGIIAQLSANTSEGIDETNRRSRVERQVSIVGAGQAPIYIPGLLNTGEDTGESR